MERTDLSDLSMMRRGEEVHSLTRSFVHAFFCHHRKERKKVFLISFYLFLSFISFCQDGWPLSDQSGRLTILSSNKFHRFSDLISSHLSSSSNYRKLFNLTDRKYFHSWRVSSWWAHSLQRSSQQSLSLHDWQTNKRTDERRGMLEME